MYHFDRNATGCWNLAATVTGVDPLGEFGYALALDQTVSPPIVAVSAPAANLSLTKIRAGRVFVYDPLSVPDGSVKASELVLNALIAGEDALARTGMAVAFEDINGDAAKDLVVGSPMTNGVLMYNNREAGAVSAWLKMPMGTIEISKVCDGCCEPTQF